MYTAGVNKIKIGLFVGLTYVLSLALVIIYKYLGGNYGDVFGFVVAILYMFIPLIVVLIVEKGIYKGNIRKTYEVSFRFNWWFVVALVTPIILGVVTFGISLLLPGVSFSPEMAGMFERFKDIVPPDQLQTLRDQMQTLPVHPFWLAIVQAMVAGLTINSIAAFGEEMGWRGFLQQELRGLGFWKSSFLIGLIWGIWHAPFILQGHNYPEHPLLGVFMMIVWCLLMAPLLSYVRVRARSILAPSIMHGTINAAYGIAIMLLVGGNDLLTGFTGIAGFIAFGFAVVCIWIYEKYGAKKKLEHHDFYTSP